MQYVLHFFVTQFWIDSTKSEYFPNCWSTINYWVSMIPKIDTQFYLSGLELCTKMLDKLSNDTITFRLIIHLIFGWQVGGRHAKITPCLHFMRTSNIEIFTKYARMIIIGRIPCHVGLCIWCVLGLNFLVQLLVLCLFYRGCEYMNA